MFVFIRTNGYAGSVKQGRESIEDLSNHNILKISVLHDVCRFLLVIHSSWNVMVHAQKPDFIFRAKRTSPFKSALGRQFSRLLAAEVCASALVMLDTPCSEVVWRVRATHCIHQFPLHFSSLRRRVPSHFNWTLPTYTSWCCRCNGLAVKVRIAVMFFNIHVFCTPVKKRTSHFELKCVFFSNST